QPWPQEAEAASALSQATPPFAVLSFRLLGGGTFVDASGRKHTWPATRVPLRMCINPTKDYVPGPAPGYDATLMVATGQKPLGLTETTIARIGLDMGMPIQRLAF